MIKKKLKTNINSSAILKFPELDDKFDELENRIQANTTSLSGLSEKVDGIQENVEQNEQELHNLNTNAALKNQENTFTTTNTFNGAINVPNPTSDNNATNKHYVDNLTNGIQQDISTNYLSKQDASTTYATIEQLNNKTKIVEKTNITFTRLARPTDVGANKYYKDLNFSELGIPNGAQIISVNLGNRAYDNWNGFLTWYLKPNAISLEIWEFASSGSNATNNLKAQKFQIWYME